MHLLKLQDNQPAEPRPKESGTFRPPADGFLRDVIDGLSAPQKSIPGKYLWDETGSSIFDKICESEAYYPTSREISLLTRAVGKLAQIVGPESCLVEIGSGASHKIRILLDALNAPKRYVAIDISGDFLSAAAQRIQGDYPALQVMNVCADYSMPLSALPIDRTGRVLGLFLGNSIGNVSRTSAIRLLARMRNALGSSLLLIGQDPNSDSDRLAKAYGGPLMAAFHKNILARMARELGAHIIFEHFDHEARFFGEPTRTEAHLVVKTPTAIIIGDHEVHLAAGESIRTDVSWKYAQADFLDLLAEAGWLPVRSWIDEDGLFGLHLLQSTP